MQTLLRLPATAATAAIASVVARNRPRTRVRAGRLAALVGDLETFIGDRRDDTTGQVRFAGIAVTGYDGGGLRFVFIGCRSTAAQWKQASQDETSPQPVHCAEGSTQCNDGMACFLACVTIACGSDPVGDSEPQPEPVQCEVPLYSMDAAPEPVGSVEATLVDLDDHPIPNVLLQVCGTNVCFQEQTNADGWAACDGTVEIGVEGAFAHEPG